MLQDPMTQDSVQRKSNAKSEENIMSEFEIEITELSLSDDDIEGADAVFYRSTTTCSCTC